MKTILKTLSIVSLSLFFSCKQDTTTTIVSQEKTSEPEIKPDTLKTLAKGKKIKLAILLDTSGSMDGLIEQAKNQLWNIVMQLAKAKDSEGKDPEIELALYQYGNDGLNVEENYIERISAFTTELDELSEKLFSLSTNGGEEYCGAVIQDALKKLQWSSNPDDLQLIYIAGNEPFNQGGVDYIKACNMANQKNVIINTIHCDSYAVGIQDFWKHGADITGGMYMIINHNDKIVDIQTPFDAQITQLNIQLNNTYIGYGREGNVKKEKQLKEDANALTLSEAKVAERVLSKASKAYKNSSWDLVDAYENNPDVIIHAKEEDLPLKMKGMNTEQKIAFVNDLAGKRYTIKKQLNDLSIQRNTYVTNQKKKYKTVNLDDLISKSVIKQAQQKGFTFTNSIN
jgi:hypothetical protein